MLELIQLKGNTTASYMALLNIYEQQKDWERAIITAKKLTSIKHIDMHSKIAHYYCELNNFKSALIADKNCVRAGLMQGENSIRSGDFKGAIKAYKKIAENKVDRECNTTTM